MSDKQLDVYLFEYKVGILTQLQTGRLNFEYTPEWLSSPNQKPLSVSLPLKKHKFDDAETRPFFAGLLPDDVVRAKLAKILGVSEKNDYALLEELGRECAGAISIYPVGEKQSKTKASIHYVDDKKLAELISVLPDRPLLAGLSGFRLSLAGAQNKMAVRIVDGRYALPDEEQPSTHIIKPAIQGIKNSITNEFFCMRLAQKVIGKDFVPNVEWKITEGTPYLLIERYDRKRADSKVTRIHQEDFCQALGVSPEQKYQNEGGPSLAQCFALLNSASMQPAKDRLLMADIVIFNYLIGNTDAHGKNFSFLHGEGGLMLAPFYDLLSTMIYQEFVQKQKMAMKIGGTYEHDRVHSGEWEKMANETGLALSYLRQRLVTLATQVPKSSKELIESFKQEKMYSEVYERIHQLITQNGEKIIRAFAPAKNDG